MKYDLAIAHRVCPALAKTAAGYCDKLEMVKATAASLAAALDSLRVKLTVILDGCGAEYERLFDGVFAKSGKVDYARTSTPAIGNAATYAKQMEILAASADEADSVYFSEDDYIYEKGAFRAMLDFLKEDGVDFVTPLDHPDRYSHLVPESRRVEIRVSAHRHWREVGTTCCTFMTKSGTFAEAKRRLAAYGEGSGDGPMWLGLTKDAIFSPSATIGAALRYVTGLRRTKEGLEFTVLAAWLWHKWRLPFGRRYRLWGPMPSLAVHLCKPSLPPLSWRLALNSPNGCDERDPPAPCSVPGASASGKPCATETKGGGA